MNNEIKVFNYEGMSEVRTVVKDGEPWFVAKDVAEILGYSNPQKAVRDHCRSVNETFMEGNGGKRLNKIIPERDVYRLVMRSKLPSAQRFEDWVVGEVIPSIRKHGAYMTPDTIERTLTDPDFLIQLATQLKNEQQRRKELEVENEVLTIENEVMKPKAEKYERFLDAEGLATKTTVAKMLSTEYGINLSAQKLNTYLREKGILSKKRIDGDFMPRKGYEQFFKVIPLMYYDKNIMGYRTKSQVKITPEGIDFILETFENNVGNELRNATIH